MINKDKKLKEKMKKLKKKEKQLYTKWYKASNKMEKTKSRYLAAMDEHEAAIAAWHRVGVELDTLDDQIGKL